MAVMQSFALRPTPAVLGAYVNGCVRRKADIETPYLNGNAYNQLQLGGVVLHSSTSFILMEGKCVIQRKRSSKLCMTLRKN